MATTSPTEDYLIALRKILVERFSEGELRTLCFDLKVDYDSLPGQGKADKARELVAYCRRYASLGELVETARKQRKDIICTYRSSL